MKYNKIVLAGGNGYLGTVLAGYYQNLATEVIILSRRPAPADKTCRTVIWDGCSEGSWADSLEGADLLINLCGKNVNCRYTEKNKAEIIRSRVMPTKLLGKVIETMKNPPKLWINVTSATIYRHAEDGPQDEETGQIGHGFSVEVCRKWEETFFNTHTPRTRKIALRTAVVLGRSDSAFPRLLNLVKFGLGGKQGNGNQYVSWIHEQDVAACTEWLLHNKHIDGVVNCTSPEPIKNKDFMRLIRHAYGIPFGLPARAWLLESGAKLIGTETELILKSRWVLPKRLLEEGYPFLFPDTQQALEDLIKKPLITD